MNAEQLKALGISAEWVEPLNHVCEKYDINTPTRQAAFLGQTMHESGNLKVLSENLNYKPEALMRLWSSRFPDMDTAEKYAHNPEKIANKVYAGRMGNTEDGDGFKYRGRGIIQLTGKDSYKACGDAIGVDLVSNPDLVATPEYAALSAGWYWNKRGLNSLCDSLSDENMKELTRRINGGTNGLEDRIAKTKAAFAVLSQTPA